MGEGREGRDRHHQTYLYSGRVPTAVPALLQSVPPPAGTHLHSRTTLYRPSFLRVWLVQSLSTGHRLVGMSSD